MGIIFLGIIFATVGVWIWSIIDMLGRSNHEWQAIGQDRVLWLLGLFFLGLPVSIAYLAAIRPKFDRIPALGAMPGYAMLVAAPPGWYPDPSGMPMLRWFDGRQWTPQTAPMPQGPMHPDGPVPPGGPGAPWGPPGRPY